MEVFFNPFVQNFSNDTDKLRLLFLQHMLLSRKDVAFAVQRWITSAVSLGIKAEKTRKGPADRQRDPQKISQSSGQDGTVQTVLDIYG